MNTSAADYGASTTDQGRKLVFRHWGEKERELEFLNLDPAGPSILALDAQRRRITLRLDLPDAIWRTAGGPIAAANSRPARLERCALSLPTCFATEAAQIAFDAKADNDEYLEAVHFSPARLFACKVSEDSWSPTERTAFRKVVKCRHSWQRRTVAAIVDELCPGRAPAHGLMVPAPTSRATARRERWTNGARDLIRAARDAELCRRWAEQEGIDLAAIPAEAEQFRGWLAGAATMAAARVRSFKRSAAAGIERVPTAAISPDGWAILLARVRYRLIFSNGQRVWLNHVELDMAPEATPDPIDLTAGPVCLVAPGWTTIWPLDAHATRGDPITLPAQIQKLLKALAEAPGRTLTNRQASDALRLQAHGGENRLRRILIQPIPSQLLRLGILITHRDQRGIRAVALAPHRYIHQDRPGQ